MHNTSTEYKQMHNQTISWNENLWEIQTRKWVIQTTGESRSVSEVHKSNLGARFNKNHQITDKLHTMIVGNKIILDYLTLKLLLIGL